jgi:hypothetical protein
LNPMTTSLGPVLLASQVHKLFVSWWHRLPEMLTDSISVPSS